MRPTEFGHAGAQRVRLSRATGSRPSRFPERAIGTSVCEDAFCCARPDSRRAKRCAGSRSRNWTATAGAPRSTRSTTTGTCCRTRPTTFRSTSSTTLDDGGRYERTVAETDSVEVSIGAEFRYDDIGNVGVDEYEAGEFVANIAQNSVQEASLGVFTEVSWRATDQSARDGRPARRRLYVRRDRKDAGQLRRWHSDSRGVAEARRRVRAHRRRRALRQLGRGFPLERRARRRQPERPGAGLITGRGSKSSARASRSAR